MFENLTVPRKLIDEARRRGIDVEELLIETLAKILNIDPNEVALARLEIILNLMYEAEKYLREKNPIQASEKLYKVVEECIKALAERHVISEYREALEYNRWRLGLLDKAAVTLSKILNEPRIMDVWDSAYYLHVQGFHEARLGIEEVEARLSKIKWLVNYVEEKVKEK
jgi:hypothetical protein